MTTPARVAVVGSGVAGLTAAWVLHRAGAKVTLFEADARLGGHADTHDVDGLAIDTGFIVHNERTYPTLLRLFAELGVETQESEMSMSISSPELEWAGALGWRGVVPTPRNLANPTYLRMLAEIPRFHRAARVLLAAEADDQTLAAFLTSGRFTAYFRHHFMEPLVAAVWSCDPEVALDYPARYLFEFLDHHGMLSIKGSPAWRTVVGGSRTYVDRIAAALPDVRIGTKVTSLLETTSGIELTDGNGTVRSYDAAVVATHPSQALAILAEPTTAQAEVLSAIGYSRNTAQLHTDTSLLPRAGRAWACWNFLRREPGSGKVTVTYDLTRLMRLPTPTHYLVTLGGADLVDPATVIDTMEYEHPLYTPISVAAQRRLPELGSDRLAFAGAWHGWGFHEDGARSGLVAAERLGAAWPGSPRGTAPLSRPSQGPKPADHPTTPTVYDVTIRHTRRQPLRHEFTYRSTTWLVDLDHLPEPNVLAAFEARDHLGDPNSSLRANVDAFLARHGIDLQGGRVRMLAHPRSLGYCFNPISVFWCDDHTGSQAAVVVEVHNTYGDRHAYLVHPDARGRASIGKAMYVSPFHDVSGTYDLAVPAPGHTLAITIRLDSFTASMTGRPQHRRPRSGLRTLWAPTLGMLRIRLQGLRLWRRGLKVEPRPHHPSQDGVQ